MKRIAAFILLMLYFVTSSGATLHYHFCMGEMANISLWADKEKECSKCGMEKKGENSGCCSDEQQWIKIEDDQKANTTPVEFSKFQVETFIIAFYYSQLLVSKDQANPFPESRSPLRSCELPAYLLNCVFRI